MQEYIIAISNIKGVGGAFFKKNISIFRGDKLNVDILQSKDDRINQETLSENLYHARRCIQECKSLNIKIITIIDEEYPPKLLEINDPPPVLFAKGNLSLLNMNVISIIGTRKSSELGNRIASKIGTYFSSGNAICNGLVDGIDKHSILNKDKIAPNVIGVLSGGLNFEYTSSKSTRQLASLVISNNGLLISEVEPNKKEDQFSGSKSSRIQSGLSSALILVQSTIDGGSKYTVKTFCSLYRPMGIVKYIASEEFNNDESFGANRLIIKKGIVGVAEFCGYKTTKAICISDIVPISSTDDYQKLLDKICMSSPRFF